MSEREYEAWCERCRNHWYLRLRGINDYVTLVRCPKCGGEGMAELMLPLPK